MAVEITYAEARANLKALLDEVATSREPVIIHRRDGEDVALISVDELRSLIESVHLLKSPKNAQRLLRALQRATLTAAETAANRSFSRPITDAHAAENREKLAREGARCSLAPGSAFGPSPGNRSRKVKAAAQAAATESRRSSMIGDVGLLQRPPSRPLHLCSDLVSPGRARG